MVLDTYLLNTQQYKVRIKGKVELHSPLYLCVVAIEKGAFWWPRLRSKTLLTLYQQFSLGTQLKRG